MSVFVENGAINVINLEPNVDKKQFLDLFNSDKYFIIDFESTKEFDFSKLNKDKIPVIYVRQEIKHYPWQEEGKHSIEIQDIYLLRLMLDELYRLRYDFKMSIVVEHRFVVEHRCDEDNEFCYFPLIIRFRSPCILNVSRFVDEDKLNDCMLTTVVKHPHCISGSSVALIDDIAEI